MMASCASDAAVFHGLLAVCAVSSIPDGSSTSAGGAYLQSVVLCLKCLRIERAHHAATLLALGKPEIFPWAMLGSEGGQNTALPTVNIRWPATVRAPDDMHPAADKVSVRIVGVITFIDHRTAAYRTIGSVFRIAGVSAYRAEFKLSILTQAHYRSGLTPHILIFIRPAFSAARAIER